MNEDMQRELCNFLVGLNSVLSPSKIREMCLGFIDSMCVENAPLDPRNDIINDSVYSFHYALAKDLIHRELNEIAYQVLQGAWRIYQQIQCQSKIQPIYKAAIAALLSDLYVRGGDLGAAARWGLITDASDVLYNENIDGGGRQRLIAASGIPDDALDKLRAIAVSSRRQVLAAGDWSIPESFEEDIVTKFLAEHQEYGVLFARHVPAVHEFPLSQPYFDSLIQDMDNTDEASAKGRALEDLATYLTLLVPGWIPRRNVTTISNESESDIIVSNLTWSGNLNAELFGREFLIECKNWKRPVGTAQIGYFLYRMRFTRTKFGIIFAPNGITGERRKHTAAKSLIQRAFSEDGSICIHINRTDLANLSTGVSTFWAMVVEKARAVQYGRSMYKAHS